MSLSGRAAPGRPGQAAGGRGRSGVCLTTPAEPQERKHANTSCDDLLEPSLRVTERRSVKGGVLALAPVVLC